MEAATQLAPQDMKIAGFEFREIHFLNALQVADNAQGIEMQVTLSHMGHEDFGSTTWYKFRVFTFNPRRECVEHAYGSIRTHVASPDQPDQTSFSLAHHKQGLKMIRQSCHVELDSDVLYGIIRENGVNYGPKFQTLRNLRIDRRGGATADIQSWSGEGSNEFQRHGSAYIMHPATMDGLLQLVFPALNEGGSRSLPAMVPSYIKKLVIATHHGQSFDYVDQQPLLATTQSSMHGYNGTRSDVVALSKLDGKVICAIEGYQTKFVGSVNDDSVAEVIERPLHSQIVWLPDLDLMTNEQVSQFCAQALPENDGGRQSFLHKRLTLFTSLLAHKNPTLKVLQIGDSTEDPASFARALSSGERSPWVQYTYTSNSQEELVHAEAEFEGFSPNIQLKTLQLDQDLTSQGFESSFYDLIVVSRV